MKRVEALPGWVMPTATVLVVLAVWEAVVRLASVPTFIAPAPSAVFDMMLKWQQQMPGHIATTLYETLVGFLISIVIGVPIAVLIVSSPFLSTTIYPLLLVLQSVPKVAIAPLLLLWVGYGQLPKIIVVFLVAFFPIVIGTAAGLNSAPPDMLDLVRALSASKLQTFVKVRFPWAMPQIFVGLKVAITLAVIGAVIGEFVGSDQGLGYLIVVSAQQINTALAFAAMVLLSLMSIVLFYVVEWLERLLVPWAEDTAATAQ